MLINDDRGSRYSPKTKVLRDLLPEPVAISQSLSLLAPVHSLIVCKSIQTVHEFGLLKNSLSCKLLSAAGEPESQLLKEDGSDSNRTATKQNSQKKVTCTVVVLRSQNWQTWFIRYIILLHAHVSDLSIKHYLSSLSTQITPVRTSLSPSTPRVATPLVWFSRQETTGNCLGLCWAWPR